MDIADKIKYLRKKYGLTLEQVGNAVGVGKSTVRKWETGQIANMRRDKIEKLAVALHTTPAYLMGWTENEIDFSSLTQHEQLVINAYRNHPTMREAVDRLLGVPSEPDTSISEEIIDDLVNTVNKIDSNIQKARYTKTQK